MGIKLEVGNVYKITGDHRYINRAFLPHIHKCGNRFRVLEIRGDAYQTTYGMECIGCGHRYQSTGGATYEPAEALPSEDPNMLFQHAKKANRSR